MKTKLLSDNKVYVTEKRTLRNPNAKLNSERVITEIKSRLEERFADCEHTLEAIRITKVVKLLPGVLDKGYVVNVEYQVTLH